MSHEPNVPASSGSIIPFGHVVVNIGNGFSAATSVFTSPYDGAYMFFVHADISADYRAFELRKNGHTVVACHNDGNMRRIACGTTMSLHAGDEVTVVHAIANTGVVDAGYETAFSGFRIG